MRSWRVLKNGWTLLNLRHVGLFEADEHAGMPNSAWRQRITTTKRAIRADQRARTEALLFETETDRLDGRRGRQGESLALISADKSRQHVKAVSILRPRLGAP